MYVSYLLTSTANVIYDDDFIFLKVSTNGFVSFDGEFITDSHNVQPFSSSTIPRPIIAPLWADFNFREEGTVYYRVTHDNSTLNSIAQRIASHNSNYTGYRPSEAVIVTWFLTTLFDGAADFVVRYTLTKSYAILLVCFFPQTNFQLILVTDERISFAIYLYDENDLGSITGVPSMLGFSAADGRRFHRIESGSQERVFRIDGTIMLKN